MKRYRFLLLAFFLANNVHAEGLISTISVAPVIANINSTPYTKDATRTKTIKTSGRGISCKTYEGKTYGQGEGGYADV